MSKLGIEPKADLDMGRLLEAITNTLSEGKTTMTPEEAIKFLQEDLTYRRAIVQEEIKKIQGTGPENKPKSEKFMADIAATPGVTKLASGVVYKVVKDGEGPSPTTHDTVTVSFRCTTVDGAEVWQVEHAGGFPLTPNPRVPRGLVEALMMMKTNSHWIVYLPYEQAFGDSPGIPDARRGFKVGPDSALVFDVTLEEIKAMPAQPASPMMPPGGSPQMMRPPMGQTPPVTSSSIVRVPSAEDMKKGEVPRVMTDAEIEAAKAEAAKAAQTNSTPK